MNDGGQEPAVPSSLAAIKRNATMNDSLLLREATVQEIQLELIRRTTFNAFDGERIYASLMKHRAYWQAVLLDRPGLANYQKPGRLLMSGLIKLRDLDDNLWNADQLFSWPTLSHSSAATSLTMFSSTGFSFLVEATVNP